MELVQINNPSHSKREDNMFFPQHDFVLIDQKRRLCQLTAVETAGGRKLDLSVITAPEYRHSGYAQTGIKMLVQWATQNHYQAVTLTNIFEFRAIDKIAENLHFERKINSWSKSLIGRLS